MDLYGFESFQPKQRVQLHPATDRWMMGDRFGEVLNVVRSKRYGHYVVVLTDRGSLLRLQPRDIGEIL
jgi:hypothetical protein